MVDLTEAESVISQIQDSGRAMAEAWMRRIVANSKNESIMSNQLLALYFASISIMATHVMNQRDQAGIDPLESIHAMKCDLISELRQMDEVGITDYLEVGEKNET